MKLVCFFLIFGLLYGCMPNQSLSVAAAAEMNVASLFRLEKGMTQTQVLKIMRQPYSDAMFLMDNDTYDVWFYVTELTVLGQSRMMPLNLTPLTFKNGILIGWGYSYYNYLKKRQLKTEKAKLAPPIVPETETPKELENKQFEKLLKESATPKQQLTPQPVKPAPSPSLPLPQAPKPKGGNQKPSTEPPLNLSPLEPSSPSQEKPNEKGNEKKPSQSTPNWSPLELEPNPEEKRPGQEEQKQSGSSQMSMSKRPKNLSDALENANSPEKAQEKVPLNEGDEQMLEEEREENFDLTYTIPKP